MAELPPITVVPPKSINFSIEYEITPKIPDYGISVSGVDSALIVDAIPLNLFEAFFGVITSLLTNKVETFFDEDRELKTLLNFGEDRQEVLTNWKYDTTDSSGASIIAKTLRPLETTIAVRDQLWITREISPPVIDNLDIAYSPPAAGKLYLRPANMNVNVLGQTGTGVQNVSWNSLFTSSMFDPINRTDNVMSQWFTSDINNSELNIDYADYRNFVFYSSAARRLEAFKNKLVLIETLSKQLNQNSSSLASLTSSMSSSTAYASMQRLADDRMNLLRSFDGYERFLYYNSGSSYSSSLSTTDWDDQLYFHTDATWPKIGGIVVPVLTASVNYITSTTPTAPNSMSNGSWYENQMWIASEYDRSNPNYIINSLPEYLKRDGQSDEYLRFFEMIGHQLDSLKNYIDQMTDIWNRDSDPEKGLSKDVVWNIAQSFGIDLPNQYSLNSLSDFSVGTAGGKNYRSLASETWKRFLHNHIFMMKTKGTKTSLRTLANVYGILPTTLQIRESATPSFTYPTGSFEQYEEQTNALDIVSGSYVILPWSASGVNTQTIEVRFSTTHTTNQQTLVQGGSLWGLTIDPLSGSWARLTIESGSTTTLSSSYLELLSGDFYTAVVEYNVSGMKLFVKRADGEDIIDSSVTQESAPGASTIWYTPYTIQLGGSGSHFAPSPFVGSIDEFRMWGEQLSSSIIDNHVKYPGLYNGNTNESARDNLYVRLSFNKPINLGATSSLSNESPHINSGSVTGSLMAFTTVGFPNEPLYPKSMTIFTRDVVRYMPNAGGSQFTSNKITVAPAPVHKTITVSGSVIPILSSKDSMVTHTEQSQKIAPSNIIGFYFSVAEAINDSIIRTFGNIDLQDLIGDPEDQERNTYIALEDLSKLYWDHYAYNFDINTFIKFVNNILDPLFIQAKKLVPARAQLIAGIVHEPHVLERAKVARKAPKFSAGRLTKRTSNDTYNLDDTIDTNLIIESSAELPQYDWHIDTSLTTLLETEMPQYDYIISTFGSQDITSQFIDYSALVDTSLFSTIYSEFLTKDATIDLSVGSIQAKKYANTVYDTAESSFPKVIYPITNFDTLDSSWYFLGTQGLVRIVAYQKRRSNQAVLVSKNNWAYGTSYSRNDYVTQSVDIVQYPSASAGNGFEYVCSTTDANFVSIIPPSLDRTNWKRMTYISDKVLISKKAIIISGSVSVANTTSAYPSASGYRENHYRFTRDNRQRVLRGQWIGCLQTQATTIDGKDPIETFTSAGDVLTVRNPGEPVQSTDNVSGPILDVQ